MATTDFNEVLTQLTHAMQSFHQEVQANGGTADEGKFEALAKLIKEDSQLMQNEELEGREISVKSETVAGIATAAKQLQEDQATLEQAGLLQVNFFIDDLKDFQLLIRRIFEKDLYRIEPKEDAEL